MGRGGILHLLCSYSNATPVEVAPRDIANLAAKPCSGFILERPTGFPRSFNDFWLDIAKFPYYLVHHLPLPAAQRQLARVS